MLSLIMVSFKGTGLRTNQDMPRGGISNLFFLTAAPCIKAGDPGQKVDALSPAFPDHRVPSCFRSGAVRISDAAVQDQILNSESIGRIYPPSASRASNLKYSLALRMDSSEAIAGPWLTTCS
jgi:hypothetical protein